MNWTDYLATVEQLADVGKEERRRRDRAAKQQDQARQDIEQVSKKLTIQQGEIIGLADRIQEPRPSLDHAIDRDDRVSLAQLHDAIRMAEQAIDLAKSRCQAAEAAAERSPLFPDMSVTSRNLLIYAAAAVLSSIVTYCILVIASLIVGPQVWPGLIAPLPLLLPPAAAVVLGCAVINTFAQPRIRNRTVADSRLVSGCLTAFILCLVLRSVLDLLH